MPSDIQNLGTPAEIEPKNVARTAVTLTAASNINGDSISKKNNSLPNAYPFISERPASYSENPVAKTVLAKATREPKHMTPEQLEADLHTQRVIEFMRKRGQELARKASRQLQYQQESLLPRR